ncbi:MAG: FtsX-like permease family protein [Nitrosomonadales bacterium]|nr:FtsX-like permease family protein [Nitrosomonadales bacterium]
MNLFRLSLNLLRRDWRAGEWRVLLLALVLAVGSLATVGLFADRVRQALQQQAQSLIGADLRITSTRPFPPDYRKAAEAQGLRAVQSRKFPSMVAHDERVLLGEIQAVEAGYPLRGRIDVDDGKGGSANTRISPSPQPSPLKGEGAIGSIPSRGTVWVDERLLRRLDLNVGDEVGIGTQNFRVAARVVKDIDQTVGFASFAPRVLMNEADLEGTGLLREGSRISYRLMIAGDAPQVKALREALESRLSGNEKMEDVRDARPEIRTALERAEHFLGLAALTAAILAGAAMALAARRFVLRHLDGCAVMRCLGAQQRQVLWLFLYQFILLGIVAVLLGGLLGYATQALLVESIAGMREAGLPQPGLLPLLQASVSGFALLLGFAFLPLLQLRKVSPLRVLRRELGAPEAGGWLIYGVATAILAGLFLWHAGSLKLGLAVLGGLLAGLLLFGWLAWLAVRGLARYASVFPSHWRQASHNLARHGRSAAVQVVALSLGGMALLVLTLVRADLLQGWESKLPPDTPNRFVVGIQPDQVAAVQGFFARRSLPAPELLPMVRGRLVAINGHNINGDSYPDSRARRLVEREFNLSWMERMPAWNELVGGRWWTDKGAAELSVEEGIAETLGIRLGDRLDYDVAGSRFTAQVTSLRKVEWDSMRVNFFVIAAPGLLRDFPASYLTSFYLPPDRARAGDELSREFPNLLLIDTGAAIAQVRGIMDRIAQAVSAVFLFTLLAGLAVLYAALLATQDERTFEAAVLRTLGADGAYLRRLHFSEFAVLGGLSGAFAAGGAVLLGWALAHFVLEVPYRPGIAIWLIGVPGGMAMVMLAGWLGTRKLAALPPLTILREQ